METYTFPGIADLGTRAPRNIFFRGKPENIDWVRTAAIVGSRRMSSYGERVVAKLVPELVGEDWTVLSGLMYGVDKTAHRAVLACGGTTVAVLGWGIKEKMSEVDMKLCDEIVEKGGVIMSEWENQRGTRYTFPMRDRIMAALCQRIYVVEAAEKSGALITAEWGRKLKREIWAVPGPITSKVSEGTNKLIREGKAKVWLPEESKEETCYTNTTDIYSLLQIEGMTADEIAQKLNRKIMAVTAELSMLQITGRVIMKEGRFFAIL